MKKKILAIDFGTYSSLCVFNDKGGIKIVKHTSGTQSKKINTEEDTKELPSFIYIDDGNEVEKTGTAAKEMIAKKPAQVIWGLKRLLGKTYNQLSHELNRFAFEVQPDINNGKCLVSVNNKTWKPAELIKYLFLQIRKDMARQGIHDYDEVVISAPAYYSPTAIGEIIHAAIESGFEEKKIKTISEPVAAAIAHGIQIGETKRKTFVFDMGHGTLDLSCGYLYKTSDYQYDVLKNLGSRVGGIEIDDCLFRLICVKDRINPDHLDNTGQLKLRFLAQRAKIKLSQHNEIRMASNKNLGSKNPEKYFCITREDFMDAVKPIMEECHDLIHMLLHGVKWGPETIDHLLIIGGPTISPVFRKLFEDIFQGNKGIRKQLEAFYTHDKSNGVNRMTSVAIGASMSSQVIDKYPFGFALEIMKFEGPNTVKFHPRLFLKPNASFPCTSDVYNVTWYPAFHNYDFKILQVFEDEAGKKKKYQFLGVYRFMARHNFSQLQIQMKLDINKQLTVYIWDVYDGLVYEYHGFKNNTVCEIPVTYPMSRKLPAYSASQETIIHLKPNSNDLDDLRKFTQEVIQIVNNQNPGKLTEPLTTSLQRLQYLHSMPYENIYNELCSIIHNSLTSGLIDEKTHREFENYCFEFEQRFYQTKKSGKGTKS